MKYEGDIYDTYAIRSFSDMAASVISAMEEGVGEADGIKTGFCDIDNFLHGFHNGQLITYPYADIMAQRYLFVPTVWNIAIKNHVPTGVIVLGGGAKLFIKQILSRGTDISIHDNNEREIACIEKNIEAMKKFTETELSNCPIVMATPPVISVTKLEKTVSDMKENHGVKIIFIVNVDYISGADILFFKDGDYAIICDDIKTTNLPKETKKEYKANFLKCLATRYDIPIVVSERKKNIWLEYFSDSIISFINAHRREDGFTEFNIRVQRKDGACKNITLKCLSKYSLTEDCDEKEKHLAKNR